MASVRSRPLVVALVAILAIALAAATLNTAVEPGGIGEAGGGGFGGGTDAGQGPDPGDGGDVSLVGFADLGGALPVIPVPCYPILNDAWFLLGFLLVAGLGLYLLGRWKGPLVPIAFVAGLGPPAMLLHAVLTACRRAEALRLTLPFPPRDPNASSAFSFSSGPGGGGAAVGGTPVVSLALFGVLGLALLVAVALWFEASGDEAPPTDEDPEPADPATMAAIGRAAGRAADRIEGSVEADNAVFRAWKEMTDLLDVPNPEASTPVEFAGAAVEAGMDDEDVAELTSLFEAVRYGTTAPTEAREARAVAALRRIEAAYGGDSP